MTLKRELSDLTVTLKHPAQDEQLDDAEREYTRSLAHLLGREMSMHDDRFEQYGRDECGCPGQIVYRLIVNLHLHRAAMSAAHMLAQCVDEAEAGALIDEAAARWAALAKSQFTMSRERVLELDRARGGEA